MRCAVRDSRLDGQLVELGAQIGLGLPRPLQLGMCVRQPGPVAIQWTTAQYVFTTGKGVFLWCCDLAPPLEIVCAARVLLRLDLLAVDQCSRTLLGTVVK